MSVILVNETQLLELRADIHRMLNGAAGTLVSRVKSEFSARYPDLDTLLYVAKVKRLIKISGDALRLA